MSISPREILDLVLRELSPKQKEECSVFLDSLIKEEGEKVRLGLQMINMPYRGFCVFVDLMPMANWGHPVVYYLINADSGQLMRIDDQFPPFEGDTPEYFHLIFGSGRRMAEYR